MRQVARGRSPVWCGTLAAGGIAALTLAYGGWLPLPAAIGVAESAAAERPGTASDPVAGAFPGPDERLPLDRDRALWRDRHTPAAAQLRAWRAQGRTDDARLLTPLARPPGGAGGGGPPPAGGPAPPPARAGGGGGGGPGGGAGGGAR
ncbi:hypothetical protein AAHZ94_34045, partial [Streptomyces sp. HSW2009]